MEVHDTVQEAKLKTISKKKKCKKAKWLSDKALQIAEKRREAKGKGEKERYIHLNVEFQRKGEIRKPSSVINAKKQRKTIEWKRLAIPRKLEIPREHFMQRQAQIKDRNGRDLTEADKIKKRWQEYTEELYKKDLQDPGNHDGVITPRARHPGM